jgi:hypothetical protein
LLADTWAIYYFNLKRQPILCASYGSRIELSNSIFLLTMNTVSGTEKSEVKRETGRGLRNCEGAKKESVMSGEK